MKYQFMYQQKAYHRVERMARVLEVSRSGYYAWERRERSRRGREDEKLVEEIREIQEKVSKFRYGSPRVTEVLRRRGYRVGHNRVARLMRENGLCARRRKKYRITTISSHTHAPAENIVNRDFRPARMNTVWASDITYVATGEGWLYLCVIIDLYSRRVIGWAMSKSLGTEVLLQAFWMAFLRRGRPEGVIFHSDRGVQYASSRYRDVL
jgi:transposase InsO family protein